MNTFLYRLIIDPLLRSVREEIIKQAGRPQKIIDIACGTGTLAIMFARKSFDALGIDLDEAFVVYANSRVKKSELNIRFEVHDASDLSHFVTGEFGIAITSMAVHQFEADLAIKILSEMKRIASTVIIGDYNHPLPHNPSGMAARLAECIAGGDHYSNFRKYNSLGGIKYFTDAAGLEIKTFSIKGNGTFLIAVCR